MKPRSNQSPVWNIPRDELAEVVSTSTSCASVLKHFGINSYGGTVAILRRCLRESGIAHDHLPKGSRWSRGLTQNTSPLIKSNSCPLESVLVENSTYPRSSLKKRLIAGKLLKEECAICGCDAWWCEKPLVLVLDHINGTNNDNRLENLRLLCPNCNSQTSTFAGRNVKSLANRLAVGHETLTLVA